jgi:hypothetical protein
MLVKPMYADMRDIANNAAAHRPAKQFRLPCPKLGLAWRSRNTGFL